MSTTFELRDTSDDGSAMCPERPKKNWQVKSCWLHPQKRDPKVDQEPGGVTASRA